MSKRFIDVAAGLLLTSDGQLLLAQRPGDKAWSGWWELPGGKIEAGESSKRALVRELQEELGIQVTHATPWVTYVHEYPKTVVRLAFHRVTGWKGEPVGAEGQEIAWVDISNPTGVSPVLPATEPPLRWLQLPDRYVLTSIGSAQRVDSFLQKLTGALQRGVRLVQFREPEWARQSDPGSQNDLYSAFRRVLDLCRSHGAACLVNSVHPRSWADEADGIHYRARDAAALAASFPETTAMAADPTAISADARTTGAETTLAGSSKSAEPANPDELAGLASTKGKRKLPGAQHGDRYVAVSAHTDEELAIATRIGADFAVLGHVLDTPSHPDRPGMGWDAFQTLNQQAGLPVFAIGGQSDQTAARAMDAGAHGIAGIRLIDD